MSYIKFTKIFINKSINLWWVIMKKKLIFIVLSGICMVLCFILIKTVIKQNKEINLSSKEIAYKIKYKGIKNAQDFAITDDGMYIAYVNKIEYISQKGATKDILKNNKYDINSIDFYNGKLYFTSKCSVYCYDLNKKCVNEIMWDIPNYGDYCKSQIRIWNNNAYVTIGAATNSGVVGDDNLWVKDKSFFHDISPYDIEIKGNNFGKDETGAFQPYKMKNSSDVSILGHVPGNASVVKIDIEKNTKETFAWGIRNITGMDFTSNGRIIAGVGGMEDRGLRPVSGDNDYIYEVKNGEWYGWPDYSGADPINSPKFKGEKGKSVTFILAKAPASNPPAPLYQYKYLSSVGAVAVDREGLFGEKNSTLFYDKTNNKILQLNSKYISKDFVSFNSNNKIDSMKFSKSGIIILDSKDGLIYEINKNKNSK